MDELAAKITKKPAAKKSPKAKGKVEKKETVNKSPGPENKLPELLKKLDLIRDMAAENFTAEQIAQKLGISRAAWYRYQVKSKRIRDALFEGKKALVGELESYALKSATGFHESDEETVIDSDGKKRFRRTKKYYPPSQQMIQFLLKKYDRENYGDTDKEGFKAVVQTTTQSASEEESIQTTTTSTVLILPSNGRGDDLESED